MNKLSIMTISLLISLFTFVASAQTNTEVEVQHLLQYIGNAGCTFTRNGTDHTPEEAQQHILRKYNYVKNKVSTTEQVIKYAATESSFTGKPYAITCPGQEAVPSSQWLTEELIKYRNQHDLDSEAL